MDEFPLWVELTALGVLLLISALFSISETSMMALSRLRLRHLVRQGNRSAKRVQSLLSRTDRLLGTILLGNNLVNAAATALVTAMAIRLVGNNEWALLAATGAITFLILVFSEITPKVIGATFPNGSHCRCRTRSPGSSASSSRWCGSSTSSSRRCCGRCGFPARRAGKARA